eukprot:CAMPEP_0176023372 /NCGR_PEP_ID=MMETSP0120_2-20121206/11401_1 /TAXON_ID=160619 /ORGANISM="Kryptoperidinium foliaceum, Strain CCMP 1326" /LENGTH=47 /DNA_ID= /DNA_START= /DNA_END= /DNA_ORIENTATION=
MAAAGVAAEPSVTVHEDVHTILELARAGLAPRHVLRHSLLERACSAR